MTSETQNTLVMEFFLAPGVRVSLRASKPEFHCEQGEPLPERLRTQRRWLNLSIKEAASLVGVRRWTFGLRENGPQRPQARCLSAIARFLGSNAVATTEHA